MPEPTPNHSFQAIHTDRAPFGTSPFSQAVLVDRLLFVTAQSPIDPSTNSLTGATVREQMLSSLANLREILKASNASFENVFKVTLILMTLNDLPEANAAYREIFVEPFPARTVLISPEVPFGAKVYLEAIAAVPE